MNFKYDNGFEKVFSGTKEKSMGLGSMTFGLETEPREALAMLDFSMPLGAYSSIKSSNLSQRR